MLLFSMPGFSLDKKNILRFYETADSVAYFPDIAAPLKKHCDRKIDNLWITFAGPQNKDEVMIVAATGQRIQNPQREIWRTLDFKDGSPDLGPVTTWGYVFDRNRDGKIDYMALVEGAAPFLDRRVPDSYPARGQKLSKDELELYVNKCKIIFNHWADDNFDGKIDAVIHVDIDPLRDWVIRKIVARCTKFDGRFNDVFGFRDKISGKREKMGFTGRGVPYRPLGAISDSINKDKLQRQTDILRMINRAVAECKIKNLKSE